MYSQFVNTNAKIKLIVPAKSIRYFVYIVGNGISWSGVMLAEVYGAEIENATNVTVSSSWHQITAPNGSAYFSNADGKEVYYARERIGYDYAANKAIWGEWQYTGEFERNLQCADIKPPSPSPSPSPFPNPPPRRQNKVDECCRQNLAFLRLIYTKLGLAKFPGQLPNTIIQEVAEEGEEPAEPPQVPIPDLVSLLNWTFERDDERWGQWVVQINVKDSDITKEGDQGKQVKFPNLAEAFAEMEGQILSLTANVDSLVAITTKNLVESGLGRQEAIKSYLAAKSI
jgi:hypothetical protein